MMRDLLRFKAWRFAIYLIAFLVMLVEEGARGLRTGYDLWLAMVQQHEAGHRRLKEQRRQLDEQERKRAEAWRTLHSDLLAAARPALEAKFSDATPLPATGAKTIKFRRYSPHPMDAQPRAGGSAHRNTE